MKGLSKLQMIGYMVAIFVAGGLCGGFLGYDRGVRSLRAPKPAQDMAERGCRFLERELSLSSDQVDKIRPILRRAGDAHDEIQLENMKKVVAQFRSTDQEIYPLLTPEQTQKLQEIDRRREEFLKRHEGGRPPGKRPGSKPPEHSGPKPSRPAPPDKADDGAYPP